MTIKMSEGKVFYQKKCSLTKETYSVEISLIQFVRIRAGKESIQQILSNHSADEREFIKTGHTPAEWDKLFEEPKQQAL